MFPLHIIVIASTWVIFNIPFISSLEEEFGSHTPKSFEIFDPPGKFVDFLLSKNDKDSEDLSLLDEIIAIDTSLTVDTIAPIIWNVASYTSWRHLELLRSTGSHYAKETLASNNIETLMRNSMRCESRNLFKSALESQKQLNRKIKNLLKFRVLKQFLTSLITIVAFHTKKVLDCELEVLMLHIAQSYKHAELVSNKIMRPATDNISPFIKHAIGIVGRYVLFNFIKKHTHYVDQTFNTGLPKVSAEFVILGSQINLNDLHGHSFFNCVELSHRVRGLVVIGLLDRGIIRNLNSLAGLRNLYNTQVMMKSKNCCQGFRLISHMEYFSGFEKMPDNILYDPFNKLQKDSEQIKSFDIAIERNQYLASHRVREIIKQLNGIVGGSHHGGEEGPGARKSSSLLNKMTYFKKNTGSIFKEVFWQVQGGIAYVVSLTKDRREYQLLKNILLTSFKGITLKTKPESVKEQINNALLFYIFLENIPELMLSMSTYNGSQDNPTELATKTQYMYYYWYLTSSRVTKLRSGKHNTWSRKRNYSLGMKYRKYIVFCQELDEIIDQSHSNKSGVFANIKSQQAKKNSHKTQSTSLSLKTLRPMCKEPIKSFTDSKLRTQLVQSSACPSRKSAFPEALGSFTTLQRTTISTCTPEGVTHTTCADQNTPQSNPPKVTQHPVQQERGPVPISNLKIQSLHKTDVEISPIDGYETNITPQEHLLLERLTGLSPGSITSDRFSPADMDIDLNLSLALPLQIFSYRAPLADSTDLHGERQENLHHLHDQTSESSSILTQAATKRKMETAHEDYLARKKGKL